MRGNLLQLDSESDTFRQTVDLDQTKVGRLSRMDALQGQAMNKAIAARRQQSLIKIDAAFKRLDEGEFGYCLKCGEFIGEARLELDPSNSLCAHCMK